MKQDLNRSNTAHFSKQYSQALTEVHFLANLMHPKYRGEKLSDEERECAMEFANIKYGPELLSMVLKFQAKAKPFPSYLFQEKIVQTMDPVDW